MAFGNRNGEPGTSVRLGMNLAKGYASQIRGYHLSLFPHQGAHFLEDSPEIIFLAQGLGGTVGYLINSLFIGRFQKVSLGSILLFSLLE
jgi:hypothetical protein